MTLTKILPIATALMASLAAAGCGRTDLGRSPSQVVMDRLEGASGAKPGEFAATLSSDVITNVKKTIGSAQVDIPTVYDDLGRATMRLILRDLGTLSQTSPTAVNAVTFNRYHVQYSRADGRNVQGVDVPYAFDSAVTVTVPGGASAQVAFEIVRHVAKEEAPLVSLINNPTIISTIADVTFYGQDQAGNDVVAKGSLGVNFGNFGDPQ